MQRDRTTPITYNAENQSIRRAFDFVGVKSSHTTHAGRGSGARIAELHGATTDDIARMGRWDAGSMENCYLTHLPRDAVRVCNGFSRGLGNFWLPRAGVEPRDELQAMIFPEIEGWEARLNDPEDPAFNSSQSAFKFLSLLKKMRKIILQDAVFMMLEDPHNVLFSHPIFKNDMFLAFFVELRSFNDTTPLLLH